MRQNPLSPEGRGVPQPEKKIQRFADRQVKMGVLLLVIFRLCYEILPNHKNSVLRTGKFRTPSPRGRVHKKSHWPTTGKLLSSHPSPPPPGRGNCKSLSRGLVGAEGVGGSPVAQGCPKFNKTAPSWRSIAAEVSVPWRMEAVVLPFVVVWWCG